jgi:hypothetical protein
MQVKIKTFPVINHPGPFTAENCFEVPIKASPPWFIWARELDKKKNCLYVYARDDDTMEHRMNVYEFTCSTGITHIPGPRQLQCG